MLCHRTYCQYYQVHAKKNITECEFLFQILKTSLLTFYAKFSNRSAAQVSTENLAIMVKTIELKVI